MVNENKQGHAGKRSRADWTQRFTFDQRSSQTAQPAGDYLASSNLFRRSYVRTIGPSKDLPLDSTTSWFVGANAAFVTLVSNSDVEAGRTAQDAQADGLDGIMFDHVIAGEYETIIDGNTIRLTAGDIGFTRATAEVTARSSHVRMASIYVPAYRVAGLGEGILSKPAYRHGVLSASPLAPFARAQLGLLFAQYKIIDRGNYEAAVETAALLLVALLNDWAAHQKADAPTNSLLRKAFDFIEANYQQQTLKPDGIARATGVSRAVLYKEFAENGLTVARYLRDYRLQKFVEQLRAADQDLLGPLAHSCGFDMGAADFARMFRRAYGLTPRQAQAALRQGKVVALRYSAD